MRRKTTRTAGRKVGEWGGKPIYGMPVCMTRGGMFRYFFVMEGTNKVYMSFFDTVDDVLVPPSPSDDLGEPAVRTSDGGHNSIEHSFLHPAQAFAEVERRRKKERPVRKVARVVRKIKCPGCDESLSLRMNISLEEE
jgi:hypothetical protein